MDVRKGFVDLVGNTPLVRLNKVSDATGCEILGKCEFMTLRFGLSFVVNVDPPVRAFPVRS